jgi:hypothetical protein
MISRPVSTSRPTSRRRNLTPRGKHRRYWALKRSPHPQMTIYSEAKIHLKMAPNGPWNRFRWVLQCVAQHFQNAAQRNAKCSGRSILRPVGGHVYIDLGLQVRPCLNVQDTLMMQFMPTGAYTKPALFTIIHSIPTHAMAYTNLRYTPPARFSILHSIT